MCINFYSTLPTHASLQKVNLWKKKPADSIKLKRKTEHVSDQAQVQIIHNHASRGVCWVKHKVGRFQ